MIKRKATSRARSSVEQSFQRHDDSNLVCYLSKLSGVKEKQNPAHTQVPGIPQHDSEIYWYRLPELLGVIENVKDHPWLLIPPEPQQLCPRGSRDASY